MLLCIVLIPHLIFDNVPVFMAYLGMMLGPIIGVQIADWYILGRRKTLSVAALLPPDKESAYWYFGGFNPAGILGLILGTLTYAAILNPNTYVPNAAFFQYTTAPSRLWSWAVSSTSSAPRSWRGSCPQRLTSRHSCATDGGDHGDGTTTRRQDRHHHRCRAGHRRGDRGAVRRGRRRRCRRGHERRTRPVAGEGDQGRRRKCEVFRLDVTDFDAWKECISFTTESFGKLNILVNNAGISYSLNIAETTPEHWDQVIATNQTSIYYGMQLAIEAMAQSGEPCAIANASSIDGIVGESRFFAYCAAKGAVTLMTKAAALHCAEQKLPIRVNSVHPGYVQSPMAQVDAAQNGQTVEEYTREFADKHPIGHLGDPQDIAYGYLYLCSDEARYVTGTQLAIDGGYTAQ